ncbi:hypothetical protein GCM10023113_06660 [Cellulomonas oligotrophica]
MKTAMKGPTKPQPDHERRRAGRGVGPAETAAAGGTAVWVTGTPSWRRDVDVTIGGCRNVRTLPRGLSIRTTALQVTRW